jgi:hypothetical protein
MAVMQMGLGCVQSALERHCTHPSAGSHFRLPPHWSVPFTPQMALPALTPLPLEPPHEIATAATAKNQTREAFFIAPYLRPPITPESVPDGKR